MFNGSDYAKIYNIVFNEKNKYPGYRPNIVESPNGDGKLDYKKRFAHIAKKYFDQWEKSEGDIFDKYKKILNEYLIRAHEKSLEIAIEIGIPQEFWPDSSDGTLRILEYGSDAITNEHYDFDLFTLMCYRNLPQFFEYIGSEPPKKVQDLNSQIHFGELIEQLNPKMWGATKHRVIATNIPSLNQYSIVYFAMPRHDAILSSGLTVGNWLEERKSRSRF